MGRIYDALQRAERERRRGSVDTPEPTVAVGVPQPVDAQPGARPVGTVPPVTQAAADAVSLAPPAAAGPAGSAPAASVRPAYGLVALADPLSPAAEHLRAIRSRVLRTFEETGHRSLLVTSPGRSDGKSTVASNLALLLAAEINRRVLLVDGDLRKPAVARLFGVSPSPGLSDVALGRIPWRQVVVQAPWNGLAVLPAGTLLVNTTELLNGPVVRQFFQEVRNAYDFVVVDAPPVLAVSDATVLATAVDAVLLVTRAGRTPREALTDATEALAKARVLGVVLNALPDRPLTRRKYYTY